MTDYKIGDMVWVYCYDTGLPGASKSDASHSEKFQILCCQDDYNLGNPYISHSIQIRLADAKPIPLQIF